MNYITEYSVIYHGVRNSQYFPGCGAYGTPYENAATGIGCSINEAIEDCLEGIAQQEDFDNLDEIEKEIKQKAINDNVDLSEVIVTEEMDECWYYFSILYNDNNTDNNLTCINR